MTGKYASLLKKRPGCYFQQINILLVIDAAQSHKGDEVISAFDKLNTKVKYIDGRGGGGDTINSIPRYPTSLLKIAWEKNGLNG